MKTVLIAVDDSRGSETAVSIFLDLFACTRPASVALLFVQKIEGRSLMDEMLGMAELSTLKEQLSGTEYQAALDRKAKAVLDRHAAVLRAKGVTGIQTLVREGHPSEEILETAKKIAAEMIIVGSRGERAHTLLIGSVSREIANRAGIPVLIAR